MNGKYRLCDMKPGLRAKVVAVSEESPIQRRLRDLGLIKGTVVECLMKSPLGDPTAYLVRSSVIALRYEDSKFVYVEVV